MSKSNPFFWPGMGAVPASAEPKTKPMRKPAPTGLPVGQERLSGLTSARIVTDKLAALPDDMNGFAVFGLRNGAGPIVPLAAILKLKADFDPAAMTQVGFNRLIDTVQRAAEVGDQNPDYRVGLTTIKKGKPMTLDAKKAFIAGRPTSEKDVPVSEPIGVIAPLSALNFKIGKS